MKKGHLLIVDDETYLLNVLSFMLGPFAEKITVCETAHAALKVIDTEKVDCILCDNHLPLMSGLDILKIVRAKGLHTPFIFFSAENGHDAVLDAIKFGAMDFIFKPQFTGIEKAVSAGLNNLTYEPDPSGDFSKISKTYYSQPL